MFRAAFISRFNAKSIARSSALLSLVVTAVCAADDKPATPDASLLPLEELRTFTRVYDHVRNGYVDEIDDAKLLEYAIKGMISELDPHSAYLDKEAFADLQASTSGEFGGIGLEVSLDEGFIKVVTPIDDSPSARAGIQAGDVVIRIDDKQVKGMDLNKAVNLMRGPKNSPIKITVMREGVDQPLDFDLLRDIIKVQSVRTRLLDEDYFYIRVAQFQLDTGKDVAKKLREQLKKNPATKALFSICATIPAECCNPLSKWLMPSSMADKWCIPKAASTTAILATTPKWVISPTIYRWWC